METKLFATPARDASFFARDILYRLDRKPLTIVEVTIPNDLGDKLFRFTVDGIEAIAIELSQLDELSMSGRIHIINLCLIP